MELLGDIAHTTIDFGSNNFCIQNQDNITFTVTEFDIRRQYELNFGNSVVVKHQEDDVVVGYKDANGQMQPFRLCQVIADELQAERDAHQYDVLYILLGVLGSFAVCYGALFCSIKYDIWLAQRARSANRHVELSQVES